MKMNLLRTELEAALQCASTDGSRYVLNSVLVQYKPERPQPILVSTDGRIICIIESEATQPEPITTEGSFILSSEFVKELISMMKRQRAADVVIERRQDENTKVHATIVSLFMETTITGKVVDANYPNWHQVIPTAKKRGTEAIGMMPKFLMMAAKASKILFGKEVALKFEMIDELSPITITAEKVRNFYCVLMPCRTDAEFGGQFLQQWMSKRAAPQPQPEAVPA